MGRFQGKAVIVTGAAGSIGQAIAARFAAEGAHLLLADIDGEKLDAVASRLASGAGEIVAKRFDVARQEDNEAMVGEAVMRFGRLDVLVNNAAVGALGQVTTLDPADWRRIFAIGVDSIFFASRAAIPYLARSSGSIVNTGSISGRAADYGLVAYNSMKGAVANLTRAMAIDHAAEGVRVNAVAPGPVRTPIAETLYPPALQKQFRDAIPMGRLAEPHEVAGAVAFLASDDASFITGTEIVIDGGLTAATGQPNMPRAFAAAAAGR